MQRANVNGATSPEKTDMRARAPWYEEHHDLDDPHLRLLVAVIRQTVVDAKKGSERSKQYLIEWGFSPTAWQVKPAQMRRSRRRTAA